MEEWGGVYSRYLYVARVRMSIGKSELHLNLNFKLISFILNYLTMEY